MNTALSMDQLLADDRPGSVTLSGATRDPAPGTHIALDAALLEQIERENRQLEFGFETGARALAQAATTAAAAAFSQCSADVDRLARIEANGVFPPVVERSATDVVAERRVQWAREALDLACASLHRQLDALARIDAGGHSHCADVAAARLALRYYLSVKREQIYPLYQDLLAAA